ncbi:WD40 repeat domain-containing protein [Endozoicomonas sp. ALC020]|uniref:WD40 repeat domain-containing protein n=1 Tax=unclassified Endozoicomonas TaxID=2644528 RepID=UPI003BAE3136
MTPEIRQLNDNSKIVDSIQTPSGRSQSEPPTGIGMGRDINASGQCESLLEQMPLELKYKIIDYLHLPTANLLKRTCSNLKNAIKDGDVLAKAWYNRFPSAHQARLETIVSTKDDNQLHDWLGQFTNDKALIKSLIQCRESCDFPAIFYFTMTELMSKCETFKLVDNGEISHAGRVALATFSDDGLHVLTRRVSAGPNTVKIFGQSISGSWDVKANIPHIDCTNSANFSTDGNHLVTASSDGTAKIYGQEADGSWEAKVTINHVREVNSAIFSPDGTLVVTASDDCNAQIYGLEADGSWVPRASIFHEGSITSANFSADGRYVITTGNDMKLRIHYREEDGSWLFKDTITHDSNLDSAIFSPDGAHVMTIGQMFANNMDLFTPDSICDYMVIIYGQDSDGFWKEKADIRHFREVNSASFSPDGIHVVTASRDGMAQIYGQKADGSWQRKANIVHQKSVVSATFSVDGRHVVTASYDKTVKIYVLRADGVWKEKASIAHDDEVNSAIFSSDGRHVVTASKDKTAKIIGQEIDGSWVVKGTISHQGAVDSATFSSDVRYVLTASRDQTVKITEIRMGN